jgi:hypothetical protein
VLIARSATSDDARSIAVFVVSLARLRDRLRAPAAALVSRNDPEAVSTSCCRCSRRSRVSRAADAGPDRHHRCAPRSRAATARRRRKPPPTTRRRDQAEDRECISQAEGRELLQSIVDFTETLFAR